MVTDKIVILLKMVGYWNKQQESNNFLFLKGFRMSKNYWFFIFKQMVGSLEAKCEKRVITQDFWAVVDVKL